MSTAQYVGLPITPARTRTIRDPQRGLQTVAVYEGTQAEIELVISGIATDQRYECEPTAEGMYQLTVFTPDAESAPYDTQDTWELLNNRVEKDLYEHPTAKACTDEEIHAIKAFLKKLPTGQALPLIGPDESPVAISGNALLLFNLLFKGTTKYTTGEYVLRYSVTCSTRASVVWSMANCWKLYSAPYGLTPPASISVALAQITPPASTPTGFSWSWLKIAPTLRSAPAGKIVISQEWWLDLWSTFIYGAVVA